MHVATFFSTFPAVLSDTDIPLLCLAYLINVHIDYPYYVTHVTVKITYILLINQQTKNRTPPSFNENIARQASLC